jgi:molybdopterin synthase catalytic subunit
VHDLPAAGAGPDAVVVQYDCSVLETAPDAPDWIELSDEPLPVETATRWATRPSTGAVVTFVGVVRDHSDGRNGVTGLTYEAYEAEADHRLGEVAVETRRRWPEIERIAILHRTGQLSLSETSVVVVVSAPHRDAAFDAARFAIDTLKASVPIWKKEHWDQGFDWGVGAREVRPVREPASLPRRG